MALPAEGSFEERLKAAAGEAAPQLTARGLPHGSPAAILVSSAAMGAVGLIKMLPGLNKVRSICRLLICCLAWGSIDMITATALNILRMPPLLTW